ncbi:hypothetical protein NE865_16377 [Phthorimaea operculella]|nr:hypothetical protein NE865_16377 [Phthorimaea operculella]
MDADFKEKRSASISTTRREKRWSMNSQRLEEIVAELMRPIGDLRHSFDTDLSALLEEYLTEAGLHALDADNSDYELQVGELAPNFAELALLLQQSASIYGRKVDFLYQHVLSVSETLHNSTMPPPTLPRMYIELEPRVMGEGDCPLLDYAGEPIGLLTDFHVAWRIQNGLLVEELDGYEERAPLRPIPLMELQAAIEANAPPSPPPLREDTPPPPEEPPDLDENAARTVLLHHYQRRTRLHQERVMPPPPVPLKKERKRRTQDNAGDFVGGKIRLVISKEVTTPGERDAATARAAQKERKRRTQDNAGDFVGGKIRLVISKGRWRFLS